MTIDDAIKILEAAKKSGVKNIILAYWEADMFNMKDDNAWGAITLTIEDKTDWSLTHDLISTIISDLS